MPSIEADRDGVFSGSALPSSEGETLYVYYMGHRWANGVNKDDGNDRVQSMATSTDGSSFEKHSVIIKGPDELPHFRDPKVWQIGDTYWEDYPSRFVLNRGIGSEWPQALSPSPSEFLLQYRFSFELMAEK